MTTADQSSPMSVEFDVPASWVRVELDHRETWQFLIDEIVHAVTRFRERGLADEFRSDQQIADWVEQFCGELQGTGVAAVASRSVVANAGGVATLITGMVAIALAPVFPAVADINLLQEAWQANPGADARVVALPCGPALRIELEVVGPGLLSSEQMLYRHIRFLVPVFDGRAIAIMVCSAPKAHAECFDLVYGEISASLRQVDTPTGA